MTCSIQAPPRCMTALTRTLKLSTALLSICCGIRLISLLMLSMKTSVVCGLFHKLCLSGTPTENSQGDWGLGNRVVRGYRFDAKWVCSLGSTAWGIQEFRSSNEVTLHLAGTPQCPYQFLFSFSTQKQTFFASSRCTALRWQLHDSHHYLQKGTARRSPLCL